MPRHGDDVAGPRDGRVADRAVARGCGCGEVPGAGRRCVLGPRTAITGEALDPVYPATAVAQAAGTISEKHARMVTGTIGALPHHLEADTVASAERTLVTQAEGLRPSELGTVADRLTAYLDPDGQLCDDTDRAARRALNIGRQRADRMSPITGLLDPATRALVDAAFSALARPSPTGTFRIRAAPDNATTTPWPRCAPTPWPPAVCRPTADCRPPW